MSGRVDQSTPAALTGRMAVVCSYCREPYGAVPCVPENDGKVSHGICAACLPGVHAEIEALFAGGAQEITRGGAGG